MTITEITNFLETIAPPTLKENYDNSGLLVGNPSWECSGVICCLDALEEIVDEAISKNYNLVIAHHPIIFGGLKKLTGANYVERCVIKAIKNDIAIYAIHTNLDNILNGVNGMIAKKLGLKNVQILSQKSRLIKKLYFYTPAANASKLMNAIFDIGGGNIGNYSECSFTVNGKGTFKPNEYARPFVGEKDKRHEDEELKIEIIFPAHLQNKILHALKTNHPYEEIAYEIITLDNEHQQMGSGIVGELAEALPETDFLKKLKEIFGLHALKHTALLQKHVKKIAVCGGAGSFLIKNAIYSKSDIYISSDFKYHEYFDADKKIIIADIGHFESEQFTIDLLAQLLEEKFPNFAVLKTGINTNPVFYF